MKFCCPHCGDEKTIQSAPDITSSHPIGCDRCGRSAPAGSWIALDDEIDCLSEAFAAWDHFGMRPLTIYLSYVAGDITSGVLRRLEHDLLTRARVNLVTAPSKTAPPEIAEQLALIRSSDYFLHIITEHSVGSEWKNDELSAAHVHQTKTKRPFLIPIVVDHTPSPRFLLDAPSIDLRSNYDAGLNALFTALGFGFNRTLATLDLGEFGPSSGPFEVCSFLDVQLVDAIQRNPQLMRELSSRSFEQLVAELFHGFGYEVELTKRTRDGGRDIIALKKREVDLRLLIECKHPGEGVIIGVRPVRELLGVKTDERASKAILATTAYFSREARLYFERNRWDLEGRDYDGLLEWLAVYAEAKAHRTET